jgi:GNAT superfamily N-acetyltransferase
MEFIELPSWEGALTSDIRERARSGSAGRLTKQYSVRENGVELGYAALDWYELDQCTDLILYKMYVPEEYRHHGVGSRILGETEKLAMVQGYMRVLLIARPLDDNPQEKLKEWYRQHGYRPVPHSSGDAMAKIVS